MRKWMGSSHCTFRCSITLQELLEARRKRVMQLMRQDVVFSAARERGGCPAKAEERRLCLASPRDPPGVGLPLSSAYSLRDE